MKLPNIKTGLPWRLEYGLKWHVIHTQLARNYLNMAKRHADDDGLKRDCLRYAREEAAEARDALDVAFAMEN